MRHLRNPFVQIGLWTFAITAVVGAVVWTLPWEPEQASSQAGPIDTLSSSLSPRFRPGRSVTSPIGNVTGHKSSTGPAALQCHPGEAPAAAG